MSSAKSLASNCSAPLDLYSGDDEKNNYAALMQRTDIHAVIIA